MNAEDGRNAPPRRALVVKPVFTCYGDCVRELAYALRRTPIAWENLG